MEEKEGLHELDEYLADDVELEALVVLGLDVAVDIHAEHFCHYALS